MLRMATKQRPKTMGMTASGEDWALMDALKTKTGIFKTGDVIREAIRRYYLAVAKNGRAK